MVRRSTGIPIHEDRPTHAPAAIAFGCALAGAVMLAACSRDTLPLAPQQASAESNGPKAGSRFSPPAVGNAVAGRDVFRFETFGNEGFWTDAMRLPQGMMQEKVTLLQLPETGFHVDAEALDGALRHARRRIEDRPNGRACAAIA